MRNVVILSLAFLCLSKENLGFAAPSDRPKPNIIVIVADDLGYADVGFQGGKDVATPNLDRLARDGVRCTNGYVTCPVCSPTRAGLMTGRYQQRFGHEFNPNRLVPENFGLPLSEKTLADALVSLGYKTGLVGKWHLGFDEAKVPTSRGFGEFFGFLAGSRRYLPGEPPAGDLFRGTTPIPEPEYLTDAFSEEAVAFIERHKAEPFFLMLTYNAVHTPMQATIKYLERFPHIEVEPRRTYAAMLSALDDGVGQVRAKLRELEIENNTLIFFLSDNGGPIRGNGSQNTPLRGAKSQVWEGGIRVPFVVCWPRRLSAGGLYQQPVVSLDIFPTAVKAAGGDLDQYPRLDGIDLASLLSGRHNASSDRTLYWRFGKQRAARRGSWKLVQMEEEPAQLFNLDVDVGEMRNVMEMEPITAEELGKSLDQWELQLAKPLWPGASSRNPVERKGMNKQNRRKNS